MVRRSLQPGEKGTLELAFYRCYSPEPVTLAEFAAVAGARWGIEDCFAEAKNEAGVRLNTVGRRNRSSASRTGVGADFRRAPRAAGCGT
jgi:hypothetical protein